MTKSCNIAAEVARGALKCFLAVTQARNAFGQTPLHLAAMLAANASAVRLAPFPVFVQSVSPVQSGLAWHLRTRKAHFPPSQRDFDPWYVRPTRYRPIAPVGRAGGARGGCLRQGL